MRDFSDDYALLAVQGPRSLERLGLPRAKPFTWAMGEVDGIEVMVNRTGYTGELGVELMCPAEDAPALWDAVVGRGAKPCGLGARDTLRLEVCYPLHGNDITPETDAISAGLGWTCALDTEFTGADELRRIKAEGRSASSSLRDDREGDPAPGHGDRERRESSPRAATPRCWTSASAWATCRSRRPRREPSSRSTCAAAPRGARVVKKPIYNREEH